MKIMKYVFTAIIVLIAVAIRAQSPLCITNSDTAWAKLRLQLSNRTSANLTTKKVIRVNFHFLLKTDGSGNFNETSDGVGNAYSGYDYVRDLIKWMNDRNTWNEHMNIPTGNATPVIDKNYTYVVDAVYFNRNDGQFYYPAINNYVTQGSDQSTVVNIFLSSLFNYSGSGGGYANGTNPFNPDRYTENGGYYQQYLDHLTYGTPLDWFLHGTGANTIHEIGHLLGLSHTVLYNWAPPCPSGCQNLEYPGQTIQVDTSCDDGCSDTPTAWAITSANNCTKHPGCGWNTGGQTDCSNNIMDYNGANALTPCQINIIHTSIEGPMKVFTACDAVKTDLNICDFAYPKVSYFGKNVIVSGCSSTIAKVDNKERMAIWFSQLTDFNSIEVDSNSEFEVILHNTCPF